MGCLLLFIVMFCPAVFARNHVNLQGPAIFAGYGTCFGGGTGGELEYQIRRPLGIFTVTPFIGSGMVKSNGKWIAGADGGCLLEMGQAHRVYTGFLFGSLGEDRQEFFPGMPSATTVIAMTYGSALLAGYKGMLRFGLAWNAAVSLGYIMDSNNSNRVGTAKPGFIIGVGYKY
jgi:hypothetical protein